MLIRPWENPMPTRRESERWVLGVQKLLYRRAIGEAGVTKIDPQRACSDLHWLRGAYDDVRERRNIKAAGIDGKTIQEIENEIGVEAFLRSLSRKIITGEFEFRPSKQLTIPKSSGGPRLIGVHAVEDAVVLRALLNFVTPTLETRFHDSSFGGRPRRSVADAIAKLCRFINSHRGPIYLIVGDVEDCFGSIERQVLWQLLGRANVHPWITNELHRHLAAGAIKPGGVLDHPIKGVPQGSAMSGILANLVLNKLDWRLNKLLDTDRTLYLRYMDDMLIAHAGSAGDARERFGQIEHILSEELGMKLAVGKGREGPAEQWIKYLGIEVRRKRASGKATSRMPKRRLNEIIKVVDTLVRGIPPRAGRSDQLTTELNHAISDHADHYKYTTEREPLARIDSHINRMVLRWLGRRHRRWSPDRIQRTYFNRKEILLAGKSIRRFNDNKARKPRNHIRKHPWETDSLVPTPGSLSSYCSVPTYTDVRPDRGRDSAVGGTGHGGPNVHHASADESVPSSGSPVDPEESRKRPTVCQFGRPFFLRHPRRRG